MIDSASIIYCKTITPAKEAPDGETPEQVLVTKEANCYAIWYESQMAQTLLGFERFDRHRAIERGVQFGRMQKDTLRNLAEETGMDQ